MSLPQNMLAADYSGMIQGKQARGRIVGVVSPFGGGFLILAGADAASYSPQSGQWAIIGQAGQPALQLRHSTGDVETFILSTDGSKTYLDGKRWFVVENTVCQ